MGSIFTESLTATKEKEVCGCDGPDIGGLLDEAVYDDEWQDDNHDARWHVMYNPKKKLEAWGILSATDLVRVFVA